MLGRRYRLSVILMVLSGIVVAGTLTWASIRTIRTGKHFTQVILAESRTLLVNTLRFGQGMMSMRAESNAQVLVDMALESRFVAYLSVLDEKGAVIARGGDPSGFEQPEAHDVGSFEDGKVIDRAESLLLIAYRAEEPVGGPGFDRNLMRSGSMMSMRRDGGLQGTRLEPAWFLVVLDISSFNEHYRDMVFQTLVQGVAVALFGCLAVLFFGLVSRYELAHLSIERLDRIKGVLANFVPATARAMIERDPGKDLPDKDVRDATVLFLDIEGYARLLETHGEQAVNRDLEAYFSAFLTLIQKYRGDVNETAGDGMMVIFLHDDPVRHAKNAVDAALAVRGRCGKMTGAENRIPVTVNIGVASGEVYLGSTKMRGHEGERWTFTASGKTTVLAARLSDYADGGQVLVNEETARRVGNHFTLNGLGKIPLKNVADPVQVFEALN